MVFISGRMSSIDWLQEGGTAAKALRRRDILFDQGGRAGVSRPARRGVDIG
jgi:hypothetical protein